MHWIQSMPRIVLTAAFASLLFASLLLGGFATAADPSTSPQGQQPPSQSQTAPQTTDDNPLIIDTDPSLPDAFPHRNYQVRFAAHGGIPPLRWRLEAGALPPGLKLDPTGFLHGQPEHGGEFRFTVSATDSDNPSRSVKRDFLVHVRSAFNLAWKSPARVNGNRIDGSVVVSNTTPDDIDLTFVVLAVDTNGRATAIGYQHFPLPSGAIGQELPFGDTMARGNYEVNIDVVGEVADKNLIYREHMQTPSRLQVTVGP
jgi:hypothetical protein